MSSGMCHLGCGKIGTWWCWHWVTWLQYQWTDNIFTDECVFGCSWICRIRCWSVEERFLHFIVVSQLKRKAQNQTESCLDSNCIGCAAGNVCNRFDVCIWMCTHTHTYIYILWIIYFKCFASSTSRAARFSHGSFSNRLMTEFDPVHACNFWKIFGLTRHADGIALPLSTCLSTVKNRFDLTAP